MKKIPEGWKGEIREMIREEVASLQIPSAELPPVADKERGPRGRPSGRGQRVKIAGTCDKALWDELDRYRKKHGMSLSRAIDAALWHFLGKPALSFEKQTDPTD